MLKCASRVSWRNFNQFVRQRHPLIRKLRLELSCATAHFPLLNLSLSNETLLCELIKICFRFQEVLNEAGVCLSFNTKMIRAFMSKARARQRWCIRLGIALVGACLGLSDGEGNRFVFSIFGMCHGSWRIEGKWPEGKPLVYHWDSLSDVSTRCCQFQMSPSTVTTSEGETDLVRQQWGEHQKKHPYRCREGCGPKEKGKGETQRKIT